MKRIQSLVICLGAVAVMSGLTACGPDRGDRDGRVDIYNTRQPEIDSDKARLPDLTASTDTTAEALARDLINIREIQAHPTKAVIELGSILNMTTTTPSSDFELMQKRLRGNLMQSPIIRDQFIFVEGAARMEDEYDRINLEDRGDLLQDGSERKTAKYSADITYVLLADFHDARRGSKSQHYWEFKLVNQATRGIVFLRKYDLVTER